MVSQQDFFIGFLVLFTSYALTVKHMLSSSLSLQIYVNRLCSVQLALQGARQDHGIKWVENGLDTLFFILYLNSNAVCRNYRENTELSIFLFFCFLLQLLTELIAAFAFLKTGCWHSWCVSASKEQYIGNHFVFQWLEQCWNYYLFLCNKNWLRCTDFVGSCRNYFIFLWIELQILVWGFFLIFHSVCKSRI